MRLQQCGWEKLFPLLPFYPPTLYLDFASAFFSLDTTPTPSQFPLVLSNTLSFSVSILSTLSKMTAGTKTQYGDSDRDLSKLMHGKSSDDRNSFFSMLSKDHESHRAITDAYVGHWGDKNGDAETEEARDKRKAEYMNIVNK